MTNEDFPQTIKFSNGLVGHRCDYVPSEGTAIYRIAISGFNDPLVGVDEYQISDTIDYHSVRVILRGTS